MVTYCTQIIAQQCLALAGTCTMCSVNSWSIGNAACAPCTSVAIATCSSLTGLATSW